MKIQSSWSGPSYVSMPSDGSLLRNDCFLDNLQLDLEDLLSILVWLIPSSKDFFCMKWIFLLVHLSLSGGENTGTWVWYTLLLFEIMLWFTLLSLLLNVLLVMLLFWSFIKWMLRQWDYRLPDRTRCISCLGVLRNTLGVLDFFISEWVGLFTSILSFFWLLTCYFSFPNKFYSCYLVLSFSSW